MSGKIRGSVAATLLILGAVPVALGLETAEEIQACTRANFPEQTSLQTIELTSLDRSGGKRTLEARVFWKRFDGKQPRVLIRVDAPPDLSGAGYLVIEKKADDDMYMYLPAVQKTRRISAGMLSDQLWGTDFSYEDIKQLEGIAIQGQNERLEDASVADRATYVLSLRPSSEKESSYEKIVSFVDQETCVILRTEFFERGDRLRKILLADPKQVTKQGKYWIAGEYDMSDVRDETRTWLRIKKTVNDEPIPDRTFNPSLLARGR